VSSPAVPWQWLLTFNIGDPTASCTQFLSSQAPLQYSLSSNLSLAYNISVRTT
jgi:hypothetical protein